MMADLNRLSDEGRTVVLVTHATANIDQCDHVAFLAYGRLAYFGPPHEALKFFNVRDFADIYLRLSTMVDPNQGKQPEPELQGYYQAYRMQASHPGIADALCYWFSLVLLYFTKLSFILLLLHFIHTIMSKNQGETEKDV